MTARLVAAATALVLLTAPAAAYASASQDPTPTVGQPGCVISLTTGECELTVADEKRVPGEGEGDGKTKTVTKTGCFAKGQAIPCKTSEGFWDPASGCYLTPQDKPLTLGDVSTIPPGSKFYRCWYVYDVVGGKPVGVGRFESVIREPGEPAIDPREAARQVVESMVFVAPQLGLSPYVQSAARKGIVNVPVWMWVTDPGASTTGPLTKRAALGGVTIEATGTVDRIEWSMGGGDVVTCKGAGTPFDRAAAEGKSLKEIPDSPTCGHRYRKTSRCEKDQSFQVTATAYWTVHWIGGGLEGDIPLQFSRSAPLQIVDLRPVLVAPDGEDNAEATTPPRACS